jgi:hypothetical protein
MSVDMGLETVAFERGTNMTLKNEPKLCDSTIIESQLFLAEGFQN